MKTCCIQDCEKKVLARDMCAMHYARLKRHGSPMEGASTQLHGLSRDARFWAYTEKTDNCWNWTGYADANGYGRLSVKNKPVLAHRISYKIHVREISSDEHLLHSCDNPRCVNPAHLTVGDQAANNKDMFAKGRAKPKAHLGEAHGCSKLTEADVLAIRASDGPSETVAAQYGVTGRTIREIRNRETWRHLP